MNEDLTARSTGLSPALRAQEDEKRQQISNQCDVIVHLAKALVEIHEDYALMVRDPAYKAGMLDMVGNRTARWMETLGDMLNGVDAITEDDDWVNPIFERAHKMFPQTATLDQPRGLSAAEEPNSSEAVDTDYNPSRDR